MHERIKQQNDPTAVNLERLQHLFLINTGFWFHARLVIRYCEPPRTKQPEHTFSTATQTPEHFVKGQKVELEAVELPLNGPCGEIVFSTAVFKVKNFSF